MAIVAQIKKCYDKNTKRVPSACETSETLIVVLLTSYTIYDSCNICKNAENLY